MQAENRTAVAGTLAWRHGDPGGMAVWRRVAGFRVRLSPLVLAAFAAVGLTLTANDVFWQRLLAVPSLSLADTGTTLAGAFLLVSALHFLLLAPLLNRWTAKPVLALLIVVTALASWYMTRYHVFLDSGMVRNVLATDPAEVADLLSLPLLLHLCVYAGLPLFLLSRVEVQATTWRAGGIRLAAAVLVAVLVAALGLLLASRQLVPQLREHREIRYLVTPANYLTALVRLGTHQAPAVAVARQQVGTDATRVPVVAGLPPRVVIVVVGETARALNWGLDGYARQTTPQIAARNVINFPEVTACGTSTEVSLPCMFSVYGRARYDEDAIRGSESLLHVVARAGDRVLWRDNQSGCKGVCDGLETQRVRDVAAADPACQGDECLDGALLSGLREEILKTPGDLLVVLHMMGNHGPAYYRRYPPAFRRYTPECATNELWTCSHEQVVNSYDNAILYTDDLLARTIDLLDGLAGARRTALLYVSDHGESLGEQGLYLHGMPRAIAPEAQTHVPMVAWLSDGWRRDAGLSAACIDARAQRPASHDNLFPTVLGMLGIRTRDYRRDEDLFAGCRA